MEGSKSDMLLRILTTTDTVGGVWSYSIELCKALSAFNVHFYLVTTGALMLPAQKKEAESLKNVTLFETDFLLEWMENPWESIDASAGWLLQLEKETAPDIIHLNGYAYGALNWKAPVIIVAHSDVWSWWLSVRQEQPPAIWTQYFSRVKKGLQGADLIIAPSATMLKYVQQIYSVDTPAKVIYNGRSSADFFPALKEAYVFSMGRIWDEAKNIRLLTEAAASMDFPIRLAGDSSFANNLSTTAGTNISYLGKLTQQEVAVQLSTASVYVLPAKYEPFGLSILEAALSGCALVLGNIDSLQEIWHDNALYVETDDAKGLAAVVKELMENESLLKQYSAKAMAQALRYTTTAMAENYREVYQQLQHIKLATA